MSSSWIVHVFVEPDTRRLLDVRNVCTKRAELGEKNVNDTVEVNKKCVTGSHEGATGPRRHDRVTQRRAVRDRTRSDGHARAPNDASQHASAPFTREFRANERLARAKAARWGF